MNNPMNKLIRKLKDSIGDENKKITKYCKLCEQIAEQESIKLFKKELFGDLMQDEDLMMQDD